MKRANQKPAQNLDALVAVIGAGPGGIATGVSLMKAGIHDFIVIDRADDAGGTWYENTYPGIGVDIPSVLYQFSFARSADWSRSYARGAEVQAYNDGVIDRFGLRPHLRLNTNVVREEWDEQSHHWRLHIADGTVIVVRYLVSAVGGFVNPKLDPGIPGVKDFRGKIQYPTSWDHQYDYTDKRVGIVGTGASSVQITPAIAPRVAELAVFQRTPVWALPKPDFSITPLLRRALKIPGVQAGINFTSLVMLGGMVSFLSRSPIWAVKPILQIADRSASALYRVWLKAVVRDPQVRHRLTPDFGVLTKRPTFSNTYLQSFNRENVQLIVEPIERFTENGIRTADGVEHELDMIVLATGYELFSDPETYRPGTVTGRDGFDLAEFFADNHLQAYEGVAIPKLPNRWMLVGPYSWTGSSWQAMIELTAQHAVRAIGESRRRGTTKVEVTRDAHDDYHATVFQRAEWLRYYHDVLNGHARTYYRNSQGDIAFLRPSGFFEARRGLTKFPFDHYAFDGLPKESEFHTPTRGRGAQAGAVRSAAGIERLTP
ncbi:monooxygenase [Mycolicibacterium llatzerense]|nr:monooxygenase [Mycolicibacterium llatzerense]